ncbi:probable isoprenylcysteine alpha-carbonyl methylesterase ICME [Oryzias melastigma]|uniref:probable isoprenylcysteine alpha-carbonyl methylesterase ICME n=1 Tax=Oryzias melastigma TaxID=30732 RepID=UPI000CF7C096|nr:probable isoprenylcysteine alpha-carbonyl methylesterase ICME [Oryzias melastigma]XP_024130342.1 probable isoprenylcysteine alpha-carbonyl methylesterase ICME [Oryzias melastigma]XP_024130344.1 probable isoprenylcysteine alpha-carbonyl methylesterase ICME [Oryzias melastigma]XP_024130345.1 probable isoprenylcysteine alpha-carbonyl methylesterase ICME [Oryzias melastigma]
MCWMENLMCMSVTLVLLFMGLLYVFCIVCQWIMGWPDKPGYMKYLEAANPRRIYRLTIATLDLLNYLKYIRLYYQLTSWYSNKENLKHFQKGLVFGRRRNKLDLYFPPKSEDTPTPLVVFVYGGAWSSGSRSIYCLLARQMANELNATVVCPDYSIYPKGNVVGMVQDVADCLIWAQENGPRFNFDKDKVVLVGHSAGAHLCALTTLFLADGREELLIESEKQELITRSIRGVIGLSGVYDIMDHYQHEKTRGIEFVSAMHNAMTGEENFPLYSPTCVVKKLSQEKLGRLPRFALLHGINDVVVPFESSSKLSEILASRSVKASLHLLPDVSHTDIATDLMLSNRRLYQRIYRIIKQEFRTFMETC